MSKSRMSRKELNAESLRSEELIRRGSEAGLRAVQGRSKRQFSLEQMRAAIKRHHREAAQRWNQEPTPKSDRKIS